MCVLCGINPTAISDGTHAALDGLFEAEGALPLADLSPGSVETLSLGTATLVSPDDHGGLYRLDLSAGDRVAIEISGIEADTADDIPALRLYSADGTLLGHSEQGENGVQIIHAALTDGPVFLRLEDLSRTTDAFQIQVSAANNAPGHASLDTLAEFLTDGFWSTPFHWNMGSTGIYAQDGALTYTLDGYAGDVDGISADRQEMVREAFKIYEAVLGIDFIETSDASADLRFGDNQSGAYAQTAFARVNDQGYAAWSNINISADWYGGRSDIDGYSFQTALHEIGHALGLGHQGHYNGSADYEAHAGFANDSWQASMMSYFSQGENTSIDARFAFLLGPMAVDWIALDGLYGQYGFGVDQAFAGDTVWGFNTNISTETSAVWADLSTLAWRNAFTILDGGGNDTVDFSGFSTDQRIDLTVTETSDTQATTSDIGSSWGNMTLAAGTVIENAVSGSGDDEITGNRADNTLSGGAGDDRLTGAGGDDLLRGGEGMDSAVFTLDFSAYGIGLAGDALLITGEGRDRIEADIETVIFADRTFSFADLAAAATPVGGLSLADDGFSIAEDGRLSADLFGDNGAGTDLHSSGQSFELTQVAGVSQGPIMLTSGAEIRFTADGSLFFETKGAYQHLALGETAIEQFDYTVRDALGAEASAQISVTLVGANDGPVAAADSFSVDQNAGLIGNILTDNGAGKDSDPDLSDTLAITAIDGEVLNGKTVTLASGALLSVGADGAFRYDQNGAFDSLHLGRQAIERFTYTLGDGNGGADTGEVAITIRGTAPLPVMTGTAGDDRMTGTEGSDSIDGSGGHDRLFGGDGRDSLFGGAGDDLLWGGGGQDSLRGSDGQDRLWGGLDADHLAGGVGDDELSGGAQDDLLRGEAGDDLLRGQEGDDRIAGGLGDDAGHGGSGNDILHGHSGRDSLFGGQGDDSLDGGAHDDRLIGHGGNDDLDGGAGQDALFGGGGRDALFGGQGSDRLNGGSDADMLSGGSGHDLLIGAGGSDNLDGGDGNDRLFGGAEDDQLEGGEGNDQLRGGQGRDHIKGGEGADDLRGDAGDDSLEGGAGDDTLSGGAGDDLLHGGTGNDLLNGNRGADRFHFAIGDGEDRIARFGTDDLIIFEPGLAFEVTQISTRRWEISYGNEGDQIALELDFNTRFDPASQILAL